MTMSSPARARPRMRSTGWSRTGPRSSRTTARCKPAPPELRPGVPCQHLARDASFRSMPTCAGQPIVTDSRTHPCSIGRRTAPPEPRPSRSPRRCAACQRPARRLAVHRADDPAAAGHQHLPAVLGDLAFLHQLPRQPARTRSSRTSGCQLQAHPRRPATSGSPCRRRRISSSGRSCCRR